MRVLLAVGIAMAAIWSPAKARQIIPPGALTIDGVPVSCCAAPTVISPMILDAAINNGQAIPIKPMVVGQLPTILKLFVYAYECGRFFVAPGDGIGADCWAIRTGRDQGWFPPQAFQLLVQMFGNNPGNTNHPPGPVRIQAMVQCYEIP